MDWKIIIFLIVIAIGLLFGLGFITNRPAKTSSELKSNPLKIG